MPRFLYRFTGETPEHFLFLPAEPSARTLEPAQTVICSRLVDHPRLELVGEKPKKTKPAPAAPATEDIASPKEA